MKRAALGALLSHWWRHPIQLLTLLSGLALATGLWSAVQAINGEARASYASAAAQLGAGQSKTLVSPSGSIPLTRYVTLRRSGWQLSPVLEGRWQLNNGSVKLIGVDVLSHPIFSSISNSTNSDTPVSVDVLAPSGRLFIHPNTAHLLESEPGLPPITLSDELSTGVVITDISLASRLLQRPEDLTRLIVLPDQLIGLEPLETLAPGLVLQSSDETQISRLTDSFHLNLTAFGLLSFAVGLFIVHGTVGLGIEQRRGLFRTLRALGAPLNLLTTLIFSELILVALVAGTVGLLLGYMIAAVLLPDVSATLDGLYGAQVNGSLELRPGWILSGLAMSVVGTLAASIQGIFSTYKTPLLISPGVQTRTLYAIKNQRIMATIGISLVLLGIAILLVFDGLIAGFAFLAGLLLGAALVLPLILTVVLSICAKFSHSALGEWVWADMRAQIPGISLALMALLLAMAANIGVGTMASSFRLTFQGWLDQRLSSELYVTIKDESRADNLVDWLEQRNVTVLPIRSSEVTYKGASLRIYGVVDDNTYRANWPMLQSLPQVWDQIASGSATLINEQLSRRHDIQPGDTIFLTPDWQATVVGIYSDYGNPNIQAIVSLPSLLQHTANVPNRRFGLRLPQEQYQEISQGLLEVFENDGITVTNQAEIKSRSLQVFDRTFVVTGALNILTLGVAGFAILTSLLTLWNTRLPQLAPIWALGITRRQLARIELFRSLALALFTSILALPLGLVLAWALLSIINVDAFGWKLPMYLFHMDWIRLLLLSLTAAAIAAAIPASRLARIRPSDLLKVFANER